MNMPKKFKSKRGMTLVEVVTVVALLAIVLGLAVPNLVAESERIKMTALNGYARSVAVALQSEMYGMKNSGTVENSEYAALITSSSDSMTMAVSKRPLELRISSSFLTLPETLE